MSKSNPIKKIFDLYTSDLKSDDIERLLKRESTETYDFYKNQIPKADHTKNKFVRALIFARSLFNAFLLRLSAARRIFYLAALLIFIIGIINATTSYIIFGFIVLNLLLAFELADKLTVKDELSLARKIQSNLLPKDPPKIDNIEISTYYESAREVGGDYYDFMANEGKNYIVIGDISGKGMAAALYMVRVQAIIQFLVKQFDSLTDIIINLKKYFSQNLRKEFFLTLMIASIDAESRIRVCRAGHMPVLWFKSDDGLFEEINPKGIGIGLNDKGAFEKNLDEEEFKPVSNDIVVFYTDGITEAMNSARMQFGLKRMQELIKRNAGQSSRFIQEEIVRELNYFRGEEATSDDITLIVLKYK